MESEIKILKARINELETENKKLQQKLTYFTSGQAGRDFARELLGGK